MDRCRPILLTIALTLPACSGDDVGVSATASETGDDTTSTGSTTATSESTGPDDGLCAVNTDCDDGNTCTNNRCGGNGACVAEPVLSNACRPQIDVAYPPRGATLLGKPGEPLVTVQGVVSSAAGPITSLTLNDQPVNVAADGTFTAGLLVAPGGNTIDLVVTDTVGATRRRVQSFLWSTEYRRPEQPPEQIVPQGLAFYLSQAALDDGDPSLPPDDIASVLGIALASFDIAALLDPDTPIATEAGYEVFLTKMVFGSTEVRLGGIDGGLQISAALTDVVGDLVFDCTNLTCLLLGGDGTGGLSIAKIEVRATTEIYVDAQGQVQVTVKDPQTDLKSGDVDIWSNNAWTNFLLTIIKPFIMNGIVADLISSLNQQIETQLGPALASALNTLKVDAFFDLPSLSGDGESIPVNLVTNFADADFHDGLAPPDPSPPQGGTIIQSGGGYYTKDVTPYKNDGVPGRVGCGVTTEQLVLPRAAEVELALGDDMINQVLYGAWRGGLLEFPVPASIAGDNPSLEVIDFVASGMLAPTASDCKNPGQLLVHIGDLRFDAQIVVLDKPMSFTAFTSMLARLEIAADGQGISIGVPEVLEIRTELNANEDNMIDAETFIAEQLEEGLIATLIEALGGGGLGAIDLPTIDLSAQLGLPPDTATLKLTAEGASRQPGTTLISAHF
jgi:hypothetical protein